MAKYDLGYDLNEAMKRQDLSQDDLNALRQPPIDGMPATITDKQVNIMQLQNFTCYNYFIIS